MEPSAERLQLLVDMRRYREAETLVREYLTQEPEVGYWHT